MHAQLQPETRSILIVEDEALIAMQLEDMLDAEGLGPVALAGSIDQAFVAIDRTDLRAALIDISLAGQPIWPVADRLAEQNIPFILCSGGFADIPLRHADAPQLPKPYGPAQLRTALTTLGVVSG